MAKTQAVFDRSQVERVARLYPTTRAAADVLGANPQSFHRYCKTHGIQTPNQRRGQRTPSTPDPK